MRGTTKSGAGGRFRSTSRGSRGACFCNGVACLYLRACGVPNDAWQLGVGVRLRAWYACELEVNPISACHRRDQVRWRVAVQHIRQQVCIGQHVRVCLLWFHRVALRVTLAVQRQLPYRHVGVHFHLHLCIYALCCCCAPHRKQEIPEQHTVENHSRQKFWPRLLFAVWKLTLLCVTPLIPRLVRADVSLFWLPALAAAVVPSGLLPGGFERGFAGRSAYRPLPVRRVVLPRIIGVSLAASVLLAL